MSRIVIVGGHGKVALLLAPLLAGRGDQVVSLIRDPAQSGDVTAAGAEPLVWSAGAGGKGGPERTDAIDRVAAIRSMEAAAAAGARRYVMVSFIGSHGEIAEDHPLLAYALAKLAADRHLQTTDLDWTILGPGLLTLDEPTGRITLGRSVDGMGANYPTSRANVAAVIAAALSDDRTIGKVIPFCDGDVPIAEALADVPAEFADLS